MTPLDAISAVVLIAAALGHLGQTVGMWWAVNHADPEGCL